MLLSALPSVGHLALSVQISLPYARQSPYSGYLSFHIPPRKESSPLSPKPKRIRLCAVGMEVLCHKRVVSYYPQSAIAYCWPSTIEKVLPQCSHFTSPANSTWKCLPQCGQRIQIFIHATNVQDLEHPAINNTKSKKKYLILFQLPQPSVNSEISSGCQ